MIIIDSHVHIFENLSGIINGDPIKSDYYGRVKIGNKYKQFLEPSFNPSCSTADMLISYMDLCNVDKAVLVTNLVYGYHNEYSFKSSLTFKDRLKPVAMINIEKPKESINELREWVENKGFIGIKIDFSSIISTEAFEAAIDPIMQYCHELKLFIFLHLVKQEDIFFLEKAVKKYKNIKFIVCHLGSEATLSSKSLENHNLEILLDLALNSANIWFDTSSVHYHYGREDYPFNNTCKLIEDVYHKLGPEKLLWGSDYPGILLEATYRQLTNYILKGCKKIPEEHIEMIMGLNSLNLFWR